LQPLKMLNYPQNPQKHFFWAIYSLLPFQRLHLCHLQLY